MTVGELIKELQEIENENKDAIICVGGECTEEFWIEEHEEKIYIATT